MQESECEVNYANWYDDAQHNQHINIANWFSILVFLWAKKLNGFIYNKEQFKWKTRWRGVLQYLSLELFDYKNYLTSKIIQSIIEKNKCSYINIRRYNIKIWFPYQPLQYNLYKIWKNIHIWNENLYKHPSPRLFLWPMLHFVSFYSSSSPVPIYQIEMYSASLKFDEIQT